MTGLMIYAAACALLILARIAGVLPVIRTGRALNTAWRIDMPPPGDPKYDVVPPRALAAQECVEDFAAWLGAVVLASPLAVALSVILPDPAGGLLAAALLPLAWKWRTSDWGRRQLEYLGWTAEIVTAERMGRPGYETAAVLRMLDGYGELFAGVSVKAALDAVDRRRWLAKLLIAVLAVNIRRATP